MNATIVGADRLGRIPAVLSAHGIAIQHHISGRTAGDHARKGLLPRGTQLLILFTDFLNHNAMRHFRQAAQARGIPVVACKRSASCLRQCLERQCSQREAGARALGEASVHTV